MIVDKSEAKAIQTHLSTFTHNHAYPGIIQAYSGIFKTLCNPGMFRTVVYPEPFTYSEPEAYSEPWQIHNPGLFRTPIYSERWHIQNPRHIQNPVKHLR